MATIFALALTSIQVVASLLGIVTNGFMLGVNLLDWRHCRCLTASDYFICTVGISNLSLQLWSGLRWFCGLFWNFNLFCRFAYALKMISTQCSLSVSALLCVFYCTKLLNFNNAFFRLYKQHYLGSYRRIIIFTILICMMMGWPLIWVEETTLDQKKDLISFNGSSIHSTTAIKAYDYFTIYRLLVLSFGYTIPLALAVGSASLIIISIMRHTKRMRDAFNTKHEAFIDAHLRAGFTVFSILLLFVMNFISAIIMIIQIFNEKHPVFLLCQLVSVLYAPALSTVLIRGNTKLKNAAAAVKERIVWVLKTKGWNKDESTVYIT